MIASYFHTLLFVLIGSACALAVGVALGIGLSLHTAWMERSPAARVASDACDLLVSAAEYLPSTVLLLIVSWALVNDHGLSKLLRIALAVGLVWSAPIARLIENRVRAEFRSRNYPAQLIAFGLGPARDVLLRVLLPDARHLLLVATLNTVVYGLIVDAGFGYILRYASTFQAANITYYSPSYGAWLAEHLHTPAFLPGLVAIVGLVFLLSYASDRLARSIGAARSRVTFTRDARPGLVLETRDLCTRITRPTEFRLDVDDHALHGGDVVWLSGPSGSGKSLYLKTIVGILPDHAVADGDLAGPGPDAVAQTELIFQEPALYLYPYLTVERLLAELALPHDVVPAALRPRFVRQCSAGQKRLVWNGVLLHRLTGSAGLRAKRLLLCDEPDASLDPDNKRRLIETLAAARAARPSLALVYISHDQEIGAMLRTLGGPRFRRLEAEAGRIGAYTPHYARLPDVRPPPPLRLAGGPALEVAGLTVKDIVVDGRRVVEGFGLTLRRGERIAIVARNGQGKSTAARGIMNLVDRAVKRLELEGEPVGDLPFVDLARRISYVYEDSEGALPPNLRVGAIVHRFAARNGIDGPALMRSLERAIVLGVGDKFPLQLSGGQRQILCFLIATANPRKRVRILDEPFTRLDEHNRRRLIDLINRDEEGSYVLISHDEDDLRQLGCRVVYLNEREAAWYRAAGAAAPARALVERRPPPAGHELRGAR